MSHRIIPGHYRPWWRGPRSGMPAPRTEVRLCPVCKPRKGSVAVGIPRRHFDTHMRDVHGLARPRRSEAAA